MRSVVIFSLAVIGFAQPALAADPAEDMPYLRGSEVYEPPAPKTYTRWSGFYAGGQMEYGSGHLDFSKATRSLISFNLRNLALENEAHVSTTEILGRTDTGGTGFGGFVGYNTQWEDIIIGGELSYSRNSFSAVAPNSPIGFVTGAGGNTYQAAFTGAANMTINDYAQARARVGYVMGSVMPYVAAGLAIGRADLFRSVTFAGVENPGTNNTHFGFTDSETRTNALIYGWSLGGGVDWAVFQNVFVRAEFDYIQFSPLSGISAHLAVGRLGAGVKF